MQTELVKGIADVSGLKMKPKQKDDLNDLLEPSHERTNKTFSFSCD